MSEIELPVPDVQQEVEFTRALLTDGGCYTAEQVRQLIAAERERCARVCDQHALERDQNAAGAEVCAAAIRRA